LPSRCVALRRCPLVVQHHKLRFLYVKYVTNVVNRAGRAVLSAPDVVTLGNDASQNWFGTDGGGYRLLHAKFKFLTKKPALGAAAPRDICSIYVRCYSEEFLPVTLE
jgi:hypothetical protein